MEQGFRPASRLPLGCPICGQFGLAATGPRATIDLNRIPVDVATDIQRNYGDRKKPGVLVFVVDASLAMTGAPLDRTRDGIGRALGEMYQRNLVGLVTFAATVRDRVEPAIVPQNGVRIVDTLRRAEVASGSALYDAIAEAVLMADAATARDDAARGVVVLSAAPATSGRPLHELVAMASGGREIRTCRGIEGDRECLDSGGRSVAVAEVQGLRLVEQTAHPIHVYYIGVGEGADLVPGRILAQATKSGFVKSNVADLNAVIGIFKGYF